MNIHDFSRMKSERRRISMVTCYDYASARIVSESSIDAVLVGDSLAMVVHGHPTTLQATTELMALHTAAVARGAGDKFIIADVPFPKHREGIPAVMACVDALIKSGAQSVKIEGIDGHEEVIRHVLGSGVPVMGHLGMTPQSVHQFGGYRVQGREGGAPQRLLEQALRVEDAGCYAVVLEAVPADAAGGITSRLQIPTIGIGAGAAVDGQVLVWYDLLGLTADIRPKFVRRFLEGAALFTEALNAFDHDVKAGTYPLDQESYR